MSYVIGVGHGEAEKALGGEVIELWETNFAWGSRKAWRAASQRPK
jgi:hypothetical protein